MVLLKCIILTSNHPCFLLFFFFFFSVYIQYNILKRKSSAHYTERRPKSKKLSGGSLSLGTKLVTTTYTCIYNYTVAACDVTGGMASLNFDATELQILKVILDIVIKSTIKSKTFIFQI